MVEVRETLESDLQTLNQYKETFDSIKEVAELDDIDAIIAQFLQQEAENFALFNYVTELNGEIELRQEEVNDVQQNIDKMRQEQQQMIAASEHDLELLLVSATTLRYHPYITHDKTADNTSDASLSLFPLRYDVDTLLTNIAISIFSK